MAVTDMEGVPGVEPGRLLRWAGALERASEHLVARAIAAAAEQELGTLPPVDAIHGSARDRCPGDRSTVT